MSCELVVVDDSLDMCEERQFSRLHGLCTALLEHQDVASTADDFVALVREACEMREEFGGVIEA